MSRLTPPKKLHAGNTRYPPGVAQNAVEHRILGRPSEARKKPEESQLPDEARQSEQFRAEDRLLEHPQSVEGGGTAPRLKKVNHVGVQEEICLLPAVDNHGLGGNNTIIRIVPLPGVELGPREIPSQNSYVWQEIGDVLSGLRWSQQRSTPAQSAAQWTYLKELPIYLLQICGPEAEKVVAGLPPQNLHDLMTGRFATLHILTKEELRRRLPRQAYFPFKLDSCYKFERELSARDESYRCRITISVCHVGETACSDAAFAALRVEMEVAFTPNPYARNEDAPWVLWDSLLHDLYADLEARLRSVYERAHTSRSIPDAFAGGKGRVPNNPLIAATLGAIHKAGRQARILVEGWQENEDGRPTYRVQMKRSCVSAYPSPSLAQEACNQLAFTEALWGFVEKLRPSMTADVALAILAQLCESGSGDKPKYPLLECVFITEDAILHYLGLHRRGAERRLRREEIRQEVEHLRMLRFDVDWSLSNPRSRRRRGTSWQGDRLFDIVKIVQCQETIFEGETTILTKWGVRAGLWAACWFNTQERVWIGRMARVLLELDHRESRPIARMAKKIGQRMLLLSQVCKPQNQVRISIERLLQEVGELPVPTARDRHWAGRTRDSFDEAMHTLKDAGVFANIEWPDGYGPDHLDRSKGWVKKWLRATVRITTAEITPETPVPTKEHVRNKHIARVANRRGIGSEIREARKNIEPSITQQELAGKMNVSAAYMSQIENGNRIPGPTLAARLQSWIEDRKRQGAYDLLNISDHLKT